VPAEGTFVFSHRSVADPNGESNVATESSSQQHKKSSSPVLGGLARPKTGSRASRRAASRSSKPADAIALLKADHREVKQWFQEFDKTDDARKKQELSDLICKALLVHTRIEEEIFYPGVKQAVEEDMMEEAYVEHDGAKFLIAEIMADSPEDPFYDAKVKVLSEDIKHHVKEEEQRDGIFAQAKKGDVDLAALGQKLAERKRTLMTQFKAGGAPRPVTKSITGAMPELGKVIHI